jgi:nitrate reductase gamma subunit
MNANVLFGTWPYVAIALSIAGFAVRQLFDQGRPSAVEREAAEGWAVFGGGRVWRIALPFLFATHLLGLAVPRAILAWNQVPLRLYVLEGSGFLLGGLAIGAWADVMWKHSARRSTSLASAVADAVLLGLLFVALVSGLFMQALFRWGSSWGAATLTPYIVSILHGRPSVHLVEQMPFLVRLHVVSAFGVLAVLPFSRVAAILTVAVRRAMAPMAASAARRIGVFESRIGDRAKQWLWPEEDAHPDFTAPEAWVPSRSGIVPSVGGRHSARSADADDLHEPVSTAL